MLMVENVAKENMENLETPSTQESGHEATLYAESLGNFGNLTITNSLISSWIAVLILVIFLWAIGKKVRKVPVGIQNIFEIILEKSLELADSITGSRKKSEKFLPISLALFLFILVNNWLGLLPGMGTIGFSRTEDSHHLFIPLFRGGTADVNTTLTLALFAVIISHVFGVFSIGLWKYLNKFISIDLLLAIPGKIRKDFSVILVNPIKAFVGVVELIGEVAKVASLTFRLFGNIFAGEVLLASMMAICAYFLPLPFIFLEIIVGIIQALIFSILTMVFMTIATEAHDEH